MNFLSLISLISDIHLIFDKILCALLSYYKKRNGNEDGQKLVDWIIKAYLTRNHKTFICI